jgi:hypothetical protein
MKLRFNSLLLFIEAAAVLSFAMPDAVADCGLLGVMTYNAADLPVGVSPAALRKCAGHPLGPTRLKGEGSLAPLGPDHHAVKMRGVPADAEVASSPLEARDCYYDAEYGCSKGYCWKQCGPKGQGQWCWTALDGGFGDWITCSAWDDCNTNMACGQNCDKCGCSC